MKSILNALILIFAALWFGTVLQHVLFHRIPGPVLGMALLLGLLLVQGDELAALGTVGQWFIRYLSLFFIPVTVGIWFLADEIEQQWPAILLATIPATIIAQLMVALLLKTLLKQP
jgi:putative effector of murein hydrolase LrgA (UPF0299 family)